jgi:bifunctional DNA-binding transcriptional regulator/antitoxin component of YhaV-PrlF toxin-antitoxin module
VIPSKARKIFHIQTGDRLIVLGDENQGLALLNEKDFMQMVTQIHDYDKDKE